MMEEHEVVIVGGGIAGLATALALQRTGVKSLVLERADALRAAGAALSLFSNAWRALDVLGVAPKLDTIYRPIEMYEYSIFISPVFFELMRPHSET